MCGIVAAAARREVSEILLEGLRRLEYRGYDSAGMALVDNEHNLQLHKQQGKVCELEKAQKMRPVLGCTGIAHTRWATHGMPAERNAHPHMSGEQVAIVHNGIIENHAELRSDLEAQGFVDHAVDVGRRGGGRRRSGKRRAWLVADTSPHGSDQSA